MNLQDIKNVVTQLSPEEFSEFVTWFKDHVWDREFEADVEAGKFDILGKEADNDFKAGRCKPL